MSKRERRRDEFVILWVIWINHHYKWKRSSDTIVKRWRLVLTSFFSLEYISKAYSHASHYVVFNYSNNLKASDEGKREEKDLLNWRRKKKEVLCDNLPACVLRVFSSSSSFSLNGCCWQWLDYALRVTHFLSLFSFSSLLLLSLWSDEGRKERARTERSKNTWHTRCRCSLVDQPRPVKNERKNMNFFFNLPVLIVAARRQTEEREKWVQFLLSFSHVPTLNCSMSEFYPMTTRSSMCAWSESESNRLLADDD